MNIIHFTSKKIYIHLKYMGIQIHNVVFLQNKAVVRTKRLIEILVGYSFIWPTISKNKIDAEKTTLIQSALESADRIFETGKYEECYNLLKNYEVSKNNHAVECHKIDAQHFLVSLSDDDKTIQEDIEVKWRICRVLYNMAKDPRYDKTYRKALISQAYNIIVEGLDKNWDNFAVHKWYALTLDAKSSSEGIKEKIKQLEIIKKHIDLSVNLNPNDASLLHMLGEWCYQVKELPWYQRKTVEAIFATVPYSSYEEALEYFLKAESVQPRFYSVNLLRIGCCYLKLNKEDQAKYYLKLAASYPAKSNDDHRANKEAAELLKKLKL